MKDIFILTIIFLPLTWLCIIEGLSAITKCKIIAPLIGKDVIIMNAEINDKRYGCYAKGKFQQIAFYNFTARNCYYGVSFEK